jgi:hypothetical protein
MIYYLLLQIFEDCGDEASAFHDSIRSAVRDGDLLSLTDLHRHLNNFNESLTDKGYPRSQLSTIKAAVNAIVQKHSEKPKPSQKKKALKPVARGLRDAFDSAVDALLQTRRMSNSHACSEVVASSEVGQLIQSIYAHGNRHGIAIAKFPGSQPMSPQASMVHPERRRVIPPTAMPATVTAGRHHPQPNISLLIPKPPSDSIKREYSKMTEDENKLVASATCALNPSNASRTDEDKKRLKSSSLSLSNPSTSSSTAVATAAMSSSSATHAIPFIGVSMKKSQDKFNKEYSCEVSLYSCGSVDVYPTVLTLMTDTGENTWEIDIPGYLYRHDGSSSSS